MEKKSGGSRAFFRKYLLNSKIAKVLSSIFWTHIGNQQHLWALYCPSATKPSPSSHNKGLSAFVSTSTLPSFPLLQTLLTALILWHTNHSVSWVFSLGCDICSCSGLPPTNLVHVFYFHEKEQRLFSCSFAVVADTGHCESHFISALPLCLGFCNIVSPSQAGSRNLTFFFKVG